jgi:hypothetical protein
MKHRRKGGRRGGWPGGWKDRWKNGWHIRRRSRRSANGRPAERPRQDLGELVLPGDEHDFAEEHHPSETDPPLAKGDPVGGQDGEREPPTRA